MTSWLFNQYQIKTEAPTSFITDVPQFESAWHQPWSEPVRKRIIPALAIALAASGLFAPILGPSQPGPSNAAQWIYPWSDPVRLKKGIPSTEQQFLALPPQPPELSIPGWFSPLSEPVRVKLAVRTGDQQFTQQAPTPPLVSFSYYNWLADPVRLKKGLGSHLQQFDSLQVPVQPSGATLLQGWYNWYSEPVRYPKGLRPWLQQFLAYHPRILPNPDVTLVLAATEINNDDALIGINVYSGSTPVTGVTSANVSISEIKAQNSGFTSIEET